MLNPISVAFKKARAENRPALLTYTVAGDSSKKQSLDILKSISKNADILEVGVPHNTPVADGSQIQTSAYRAIKNGIKMNDVFKIVKDFKKSNKNKPITNGIFAPWAIYKDDFTSIGGHDPLYAPQSKEDSDIFNRFILAGYETIQTWQGFVYHMTCRGSRFKDGAMRNPAGQVFMKGRESSEWLAQNLRSTRNFIRKWGHMVQHDHLWIESPLCI